MWRLGNKIGSIFEGDRFGTIRTVLNLLGLDTLNDGWRVTVRVVVYLMINVTFYIGDLSKVIPRVAAGDFNLTRDGEIITFLQTQGVTMYRTFLLIRHREALRKLLRSVNEEFPLWSYGTRNVTGDVERLYERGNILYRTQSVELLIVTMTFIVRPLFTGGETHPLPMHQPYGSFQFMPLEVPLFYFITLALQMIYLVAAIAIAFSVNMTFFTLSTRACAHMECIATDFEELNKDNARETIKTFVDRYNRMSSFMNDLNQAFSNVTAVIPIYAGFSIVTSMLTFDGTQESLSFAGVAVAHTFELYIFCYVGNLVAEKSCDLGDRIYGSRWYELTVRDKKSILRIIQQCQRPFQIRAGMMGVLSNETFSAAMKTTYSIWAVANQTR